jgi:DNA polymerase-3 subunit alpha
MAKVFHFHPDALSNTLRIADMCALDIPMDKMHLPDFPVTEGHTQDSYLERICGEGLVRLGVSGDETYASRLKFELSVIRKMGFSGYFLIVWDFIRYAKLNGVPVGPGRGSGAGSLVSYSLDITTVDPIRHRLLFERFLNPDRKSMPDLDIDFSDSGREKVIEYVRGKYGAENVAQIISFNSMGARGVLKDVGRVMGMPIPEVERLTKMIPGKPNITLAEALKESPDLSAAAKEPAAHKLISLARRLEGLKRNTSVHAAGIVISKDVVWKYAPLARTGKGIVTTQYDGDILPQLGLLKMDFLGLRNLSVITLAVDLIRSRGRPDFDVGNLPMDDKKTYEILASGRALGVFQLDSEGIRELLRRLKPTNFEDISAVIALYRPGPMQSGMLDLFVERKHGKKVKVDHPRMEPVLRDTYGCIVYQEQVMELAKSLAGFTPGEADGLRKAMGKKIPEEMDKLRGKFVAGCARNAIPEKLAGKVYDQIEKFGGYGFNKSHTVAYGTISYQTAYLKANHTLEYFTALLTSEIGHSAINVEDKENKLVTYIDDARSFGIEVLGPDASASQAAFSIEGNAIRFGLLAVKHVGQGAAAAVVAARGSSPFASLDDFCRRVDLHAVNRKAVESLIMAGAMDSLLGGTPIAEARARLTAQVEPAMARQAKAKEDLARGQGSLFDEAALAPRPAACEAPPWREHELLQREKDVLGFYLSGHPLVRYKDMLACTATRSIAQLSPQVSGPVRVSGLVLSVKKVTTKKGDPMARAVIEDLSGEIPAILFPKAFKDLAGVFKPNAILTVAGTLNWRGEGKGEGSPQSPELFVEDACPVEAAMGRYAKALSLRFSTSGLEQRFLEELRDILRQYPGPTPVSLKLETPAHGETVVETDERVALCGGLLEGLSRKLGEKAWVIESASS